MAIALTYHPELYLGESIREKNLRRIKKKLENSPCLSRAYLLTLSRNPSDLLEIFEARQLSWKYYKDNPPFVVGLAGSHEEAVGLVEQITRECLHKRGDCCLKEYLLCGV